MSEEEVNCTHPMHREKNCPYCDQPAKRWSHDGFPLTQPRCYKCEKFWRPLTHKWNIGWLCEDWRENIMIRRFKHLAYDTMDILLWIGEEVFLRMPGGCRCEFCRKCKK